LLVTFGVGLILQQIARYIFGAPAVDVVAPSCSGGVETLGAVVPKTRIFILVLAALCVAVLATVLKTRPMGRRIRAVVQNRDLSETSGNASRKTDITTFYIGSGLAAVAGVALTLIGSTSPTTGQSFLIDAFLVESSQRHYILEAGRVRSGGSGGSASEADVRATMAI
jgi:urea transport system permease protein